MSNEINDIPYEERELLYHTTNKEFTENTISIRANYSTLKRSVQGVIDKEPYAEEILHLEIVDFDENLGTIAATVGLDIEQIEDLSYALHLILHYYYSQTGDVTNW